MTVEELRSALADLRPDLPVVMSKDSEGNNYSPLTEVQADARYMAETEWSGECVHPDDWDDEPDAERVVCLWPVN